MGLFMGLRQYQHPHVNSKYGLRAQQRKKCDALSFGSCEEALILAMTSLTAATTRYLSRCSVTDFIHLGAQFTLCLT